jgi:excinuclease ABC subunit C
MAASKTFDGKSHAAKLPARPGVYLMKDDSGTSLYVGKARNLRKRVSSYFDARPKGERIMRMVARISSIEVSMTRTEGEALLLENEWIKSLNPRYNILLKDDKSYPWIAISKSHEFPAIAFHRGAQNRKYRYFGPYPSAGSVRESINVIQKLFRIRNCNDSYYAHRNRPCLQYQIRRCTAPCVGLVSESEYRAQIEDTTLFLEGRNQIVMTRLIERMESAASRQDYELAATYRDQVNALKQMQARQIIRHGSGDIDFVALAKEQGLSCVQVVSIRGGRNLGQRSYFPTQTRGRDEAEIVDAFLGQFYRQRTPPPQLVISNEIENRELLASVFSESAGRKVTIQPHPRGDRRKILDSACRNAMQALQMKLASKTNLEMQFNSLLELLSLDEMPSNIDCVDISHTAGNQTVGACVVFDREGPVKSSYRRYNLRGITPGDDYAAIEQTLQRRYSKLKVAGESTSAKVDSADGSGPDGPVLPELIIIDGGKGQLTAAMGVLSELGLDGIPVMGVAKGPGRKAGFEEWILPYPERSLLPGPESPASHLVQQIRDEAHRFAITGHRGRRQKAALRSSLEQIAGVGPKRRKALLSHFGGLQGVRKAGVEQLSSVPGINRVLAEEIFRSLR